MVLLTIAVLTFLTSLIVANLSDTSVGCVPFLKYSVLIKSLGVFSLGNFAG